MTGSKNPMPSHAVVARLTPIRLLATLFLLLVSAQSLALYTPQIYSKRGAVYAREVIRVEVNGQEFPVFVEYDETGSEIPGGIYQVDNLPNGQRYVVYSGERYRSFINQYEQLKAGYVANGMAEPELLSRTDFLNNLNSGGYTTYTGDPAVTGQPITPGDLSLRDDTVMVAIAPEKARLSTDAKQLLQMAFPVDVSAEAAVSVGDYRTLLLKMNDQQYTSEIVEKSYNNIGYRVGFYGSDGVASTSGRSYNDEIYGPLVNVPVQTFMGGYGITDAQGKYSFQYMLPPCPGFTFEYYTPTYVELYYKRFNPQAREVMPYYLTKPGWDFCNGLAAFPPSYSLTGLMTQIAVADIVNSAATVNVTTDFPIDFMVLSGRAFLSNDPVAAPLSETPYENSGVIPVGDRTRYDSTAITRVETQRTAQDNYDLDGDGRADFTALGILETSPENGKIFRQPLSGETPEVQGIWLSSLHGGLPGYTDGVADVYPDLTRLPDWRADHNHRALLSQITAEDLQDTDIYVFRESDDSLLMERKGLNEQSLDLGVDEGLGKFVYTIRIIDNRGRLNDGYAVSDSAFRQWQIDEGVVDEALYAKQADHLRPGERVRLIAINRVSGYLGSLSVPLKAASEGSNDVEISFAIDDITLLPPNLRVWAERKTRTELGMTRGEINDYLVGSEGAALSDDYYLAVNFEWLAPDGSPLPLDLHDYGYTARLARIASENTLETVNTINNVPVRPGKQMALIRLPENAEGIGTEHYYVQVSGQPATRESDFSTLAEEGMLRYRPAKFVPLLTPVYDEEATNLATQAWNIVRQSDSSLERPEPVYKWLYRPEYQFSVYDLQMNEINRQDLQGEAENILESGHPVITSSDELVELMYSLTGPSSEGAQLDTLDAYSYEGNKELVFAFGEQEIAASLDSEGNVSFDNIEQLMALSPEDYQTIRLYANNDSANILWEWAFTTLDIDVDSDNNNGHDLPDRTNAEEELEAAVGSTGKIFEPNDQDLNFNGVIDYTEFAYFDENNVHVDVIQFTPFVVEIPSHVKLGEATLKFIYGASNPLEIGEKNVGTEANPIIIPDPAPGYQRIWLKNGDVPRDPKALEDGGDFVNSDVKYPLEELGFSATERVKVFYKEGIRVTAAGEAVTRVVLEY